MKRCKKHKRVHGDCHDCAMSQRKYETAEQLTTAGVADPDWFVAMQIAGEMRDMTQKDLARMVQNGLPKVSVEDWLDDQYETLEDEAEAIIDGLIQKWNS